MGKQRSGSSTQTSKINTSKRRTLGDLKDVLDDTLTQVLNETIDTKKANAITSICKAQNSLVMTAVRMHKAALPGPVSKLLGLPEATAE
jgi:hypothetical protein